MRNESLNPPANNHCLLLAVQLKIKHVNLKKSTIDNVKFQRLVNGQTKNAKVGLTSLINDMIQQMLRYGIRYPLYAANYTVEEHVPMVQRLLDLKYPGKYRISVFGEHGKIRPLWKGQERAEHEICLYLKDDHYYGIRSLNSLFGTYYCLDCEAPYHNKISHRKSCVAKCPRCCGIGFGFPCKDSEEFSQKCLKCSNIFRNIDCYRRHIEKGICKIFKRFHPISLNIIIPLGVRNAVIFIVPKRIQIKHNNQKVKLQMGVNLILAIMITYVIYNFVLFAVLSINVMNNVMFNQLFRKLLETIYW